MDRLETAVLKNEKFTCEADVAILQTRLMSGAAWVPNGNAKTATCLSVALPRIVGLAMGGRSILVAIYQRFNPLSRRGWSEIGQTISVFFSPNVKRGQRMFTRTN